MSINSLDLRSVVTRLLGLTTRMRVDQCGTVAIMMGLLLPVLIGGLGLGFEVSNWYLRTRAMQNAADAAAIAAASNNSTNYDVEAKAVTAQYGFVDGSNNVVVTASNTAPCPVQANVNPPCYSVTISSVVPLYLSQVIGFLGDTTVGGGRAKSLTSSAVADNSEIQQPICLLALDQTGTALRTNGAPNSNFAGCTVMSDSGATCNGSNLQATYGLAAGTNSGCGNIEDSNIPIVPDPYKAMADNIPKNTCASYAKEGGGGGGGKKGSGAIQWSSNFSLTVASQLTGQVSGNSYTGAMYCGDVQLTSDVTITTPNDTDGAVIVIENGQLDLNGYTLRTANGSAVTIVFSGTNAGGYSHYPSDNSTGKGGVLNIQAPSGSTTPFPGMAIYQDPNITNGVDFSYTGNNPQYLISGGVYLPNANITISGDVSQSTNGADCFVMVANTVLINGTSNIYQQSPAGTGCKDAGLAMPTATIPGRGTLVY
jgi:Flp pilus assembly protein TadG